MKKGKCFKSIFVVLGIVVPLVIILIFALNDMGELFNSWIAPNVKPDWRYVWLISFKLTIYILPPLIGMVGFYVENKDGVKGHRFWYYFIRALNVHFLVLLCIKLFADSILELDKIWGIGLFNSIKDVQTLIGYIVTLLIRQNIKIDPGVDRPKQFTENKLDIRISEDK